MKNCLLFLSVAMFLIGLKMLAAEVLSGGLLVVLMSVILFSAAAVVQAIEQRQESFLLAWFPNMKNITPMSRGDFWGLNVGAIFTMAILSLPVGYLSFEVIAKGNDLIASVISLLSGMLIYTRIAGHSIKARLLDTGDSQTFAKTMGYATFYLGLTGVVSGDKLVSGLASFIVIGLYLWIGCTPSQAKTSFQPDQRIEGTRL